MFGMVDRNKYDIRIFFVNNNRQKETLIPIIRNNIYTPNTILNNNEGEDEEFPSTRIYSDCFMAYQISDFNQLGYILYKVNHSVWFGSGSFHTNTIEGVWSKIKRLTDDFNGLNASIYNKYGNNSDNFNDYINGWICTALYYMKCEHLQLGVNGKINLLKDYLKLIY